MKTLSAHCPNPACAEPLEVDELDAGAEVICPWCETEFHAPRRDEAEDFVHLSQARGQAFGTYEDSKEIARGGMGAIVRCKDRALGRDVAIKVAQSRCRGGR